MNKIKTIFYTWGLPIFVFLAFLFIAKYLYTEFPKKIISIYDNEFKDNELKSNGSVTLYSKKEIVNKDSIIENTKNELEKYYEKTGPIGDTFGGTLAPIVGLLAGYLAFLAFWLQILANKQQRSEIKRERFENQFYEMIKLHKENVNEFKSSFFFSSVGEKSLNVKYDLNSSGRHVFFVMFELFHDLLGLTIDPIDPKFNEKNINDAYAVFFWGKSSMDDIDKIYKRKIKGKGAFAGMKLFEIENYNGVSYSLGHYYRHLFMTVEYVVDSPIVTDYEEKMKYLKILRAQLSNHEQIMLFYNWLSKYGSEWENEDNNFFTKYKMIHNLWSNELFQDEYIVKKVNGLIEKYNNNFKGKKPLFEFQGEEFKERMKLNN